MKNYLFFAGFIFLAATASYFLIGSPYIHVVNSDSAIHVIMIDHFDWQRDFYYWAQNRVGSFVPAVAQPIKLLGISPLKAAFIVRYLLLIGTCLILCKLVRIPIYRILIVVAVLFPSFSYFRILEIGHPYAEQLFLLLLGTYLIHRKIKIQEPVDNPALILTSILFGIAFWANDSSLIYILMFAIGLIILQVSGIMHFSGRFNWLFFATPFLAIASYCYYKKLVIIDYSGYADQKINSLDVFFESVFSWHKKVIYVFENGISNPVVATEIAVIFFFFIIFLIALLKWRLWIDRFSKYYIPLFFILFALAMYCAVCFSSWYIDNYSDSRYMITSYFFMLFGSFILLDKMHSDDKLPVKSGFTGLAFLLVVVGIYSQKYVVQNGFILEKGEIPELIQVQGRGIIGDYWYTYALAAHDPASIPATPHESSFPRSYHERMRVLAMDQIFLIKNNWFETFPDTVVQFETRLVRQVPHSEIKVGNIVLSPYQKE